MALNQHHNTLGVISLGLAIGVTWALTVFVIAITSATLGWGVRVAAVLQSLYIGYSPNLVGAIAGAVWGFVHGFITGITIAWFYNRFLLVRQLHIRDHQHPPPPQA